jgi:predicted nucleic acid-binding protein
MKFWDASAVVPLLIGEKEHAAARSAFDDDPEITAWWGTTVECVSAISRRARDGSLGAGALSRAFERLDALAAAWHEVEPSPRVRQSATRMLRVHVLPAADAFQLAAALAASEDSPPALPVVTYDDRLGEAAEREGFVVITPR